MRTEKTNAGRPHEITVRKWPSTSRERILRINQICLHLDFGLLDSRMVRVEKKKNKTKLLFKPLFLQYLVMAPYKLIQILETKCKLIRH